MITIEEINTDINKRIKDWKLDNTPATRLVFMEVTKEYMRNSLPDGYVKADLIGLIDVEILKLKNGILN